MKILPNLCVRCIPGTRCIQFPATAILRMTKPLQNWDTIRGICRIRSATRFPGCAEIRFRWKAHKKFRGNCRRIPGAEIRFNPLPVPQTGGFRQRRGKSRSSSNGRFYWQRVILRTVYGRRFIQSGRLCCQSQRLGNYDMIVTSKNIT